MRDGEQAPSWLLRGNYAPQLVVIITHFCGKLANNGPSGVRKCWRNQSRKSRHGPKLEINNGGGVPYEGESSNSVESISVGFIMSNSQ